MGALGRGTQAVTAMGRRRMPGNGAPGIDGVARSAAPLGLARLRPNRCRIWFAVEWNGRQGVQVNGATRAIAQWLQYAQPRAFIGRPAGITHVRPAADIRHYRVGKRAQASPGSERFHSGLAVERHGRRLRRHRPAPEPSGPRGCDHQTRAYGSPAVCDLAPHALCTSRGPIATWGATLQCRMRLLIAA